MSKQGHYIFATKDDWKRFWHGMAIAIIALLGSEAFALILLLILSAITGEPICD